MSSFLCSLTYRHNLKFLNTFPSLHRPSQIPSKYLLCDKMLNVKGHQMVNKIRAIKPVGYIVYLLNVCLPAVAEVSTLSC